MDHPANENGWLIPLEAAMKDAPGVFTHIVDSNVLVTIKQLSLKYILRLMDYQEATQPEPINWIALFDFDYVFPTSTMSSRAPCGHQWIVWQ